MKIRSASDFWCGLLLVALGVAFMLVAQRYRFGTPARMGPGFFPTILGGLLAALGLSLTIPALFRSGAPLPGLGLRPLLVILGTVVVFALLLQPLGFVVAAIVLVLMSSFADPTLRPAESIGLALVLTAFSVGVFVVLLGLPLNLWPNLQG